MKTKIWEFVYLSTVDGCVDVRTSLHATFDKAKEYFDKSVENDIKDIQESAECRNLKVLYLYDEDFDKKVEDEDYVIDKEETYYESYQYGCALDSTVVMMIKEHELEAE